MQMDLVAQFAKKDCIVVLVPKSKICDNASEYARLLSKTPKLTLTVLNRGELDDMRFSLYVNNLLAQAKTLKRKCLLICAREDVNQKMVDELRLFADRVEER